MLEKMIIEYRKCEEDHYIKIYRGAQTKIKHNM